MMVKQRVDAEPRVAIVTGAGTGLGRAYALHLAQAGLNVVVNNRRREVDASGQGSADRVVAEIHAAGGSAVANHADVCDEGAGEAMVRQALDTWGRLDVLVNNAGVDQHAAFHKIELAAFRAIFDVNFFGTLQVTHAAWAHMRSAGHGRVIVSTSSAGLHGLHGLSAYAASKAALIGLARSLAAEGASRDLFCNAIAPYAATRMTGAHVDADLRASMAPELVAPLVTQLTSAQSRVNGQVIVVGRGWARRASTVELAELVFVGPDAGADASTQLEGSPLQVPGVCRDFRDALAAFEDFKRVSTEACDARGPRGSLGAV
jgi:NAD(P)-dependent dehydrogenase (short-subunit alcohol dehydrogenase family)